MCEPAWLHPDDLKLKQKRNKQQPEQNISNLVFYAHSTSMVISGRPTTEEEERIFLPENNEAVLVLILIEQLNEAFRLKYLRIEE